MKIIVPKMTKKNSCVIFSATYMCTYMLMWFCFLKLCMYFNLKYCTVRYRIHTVEGEKNCGDFFWVEDLAQMFEDELLVYIRSCDTKGVFKGGLWGSKTPIFGNFFRFEMKPKKRYLNLQLWHNSYYIFMRFELMSFNLDAYFTKLN